MQSKEIFTIINHILNSWWGGRRNSLNRFINEQILCKLKIIAVKEIVKTITETGVNQAFIYQKLHSLIRNNLNTTIIIITPSFTNPKDITRNTSY